ncbi:MAG: PAS domain S-box protein [Nitrospirota bacterium]|nr:PAS domain S-box protein [Nitrospirota bacterium]
MPIGCITWDREFCTQTWNTAAEKIFGFTAAEVLGKHPYGLIVPKETQPDVDDIWRRLLEGDTTAHSVNENITKDGRTLICQWSNTPLRKTDGTIAGILSMVQDITESKRAEQSLRESEEKFRMITSAANDAIIMIGNEGEISFWNEAAEKIIGYSNQEALGKELHAFLAPQRYHEAHKKGFEHFRVSGEGVAIGKTLELQALRKDGKEFPVSLSVSAVKLKNKWNSIGIIRDVTEQRNIEAQLRHAQKMETVGTLAGGIAHDFNNILNVIIGYGTMVLDRLGGDQLSKGQLNEVLAAADRAANLTKRLLTFSRKQIVDTQPVNVNGIILGIEKMIAQLIGEDITFASELSNRKMIVMADTGQIEQVLINLASNARYAMPKGGKLTISTGIMEMDDEYVKAYGYGKAGMYARISVADTGSGMDAETQKRIFEPFFTTKGIGEGTGLGLSIVYGIIKQHDGYIKVYSEPGKGAEFKIYLPLIDEETAKSREVAAVSPPKGGTETILLAEDDRALRELSRTVLEAFGYTVITAENGEKAITSYKENMDKIHLLVLDMIMPEKNGKEAYAEIKNITPDIKALFISGYTMDIIHQKELLDEGMDFILKPVSPKDLVKKVREVLDR